MLSALIPSAGRQPAVPLAGQLAHESCVRPGPLVLGTAFLKSPTAAADRDRTVSRMYSRISAGIDYTFTLFPGAGVLGIPPSPRCSFRGSRYGDQYALATQMLLNICGEYPLRFRMD